MVFLVIIVTEPWGKRFEGYKNVVEREDNKEKYYLHTYYYVKLVEFENYL